jgi:hypothetical protein
MLIFPESSENVAKYFHTVIPGIRNFFFFKWVNQFSPELAGQSQSNLIQITLA